MSAVYFGHGMMAMAFLFLAAGLHYKIQERKESAKSPSPTPLKEV